MDDQDSYAGRWVAKVRGRIVGQGGTPEQALHAAQMSRHKEKPEISYMSLPFRFSPLLDSIRSALPEVELYLTGGAVRDLLAGITPNDYDVATSATPEQVRSCFRRSRIIGRRFQIVHVLMGAETVEVTTFRGHHDQQHLETVVRRAAGRQGAGGAVRGVPPPGVRPD